MKFITISSNGQYYSHKDRGFVTIKNCDKYKSVDEAVYYMKRIPISLNSNSTRYLLYYESSNYEDRYGLITYEQFNCKHVYKKELYIISNNYNRLGKSAVYQKYHTFRHICIKCGKH